MHVFHNLRSSVVCSTSCMHVVDSRSSGVGAKKLGAFLQPVCCSESE